MWGSKRPWFRSESKFTWSSRRGASKLIMLFWEWSKLALFKCGGWHLTWFQCRYETDLVVVWVTKIDLISVNGSKLTWFLCGGRKWLVFSVWIEINSFFVPGHQNRLDTRVGIEIDSKSVMGSRLTWFLCAGSKLTRLLCVDRHWLVFVRRSKLASLLCVLKIAWF